MLSKGEDRLRVHARETRASESGEQREARWEQAKLHDRETRRLREVSQEKLKLTVPLHNVM